jgi:hypothetical protein
VADSQEGSRSSEQARDDATSPLATHDVSEVRLQDGAKLLVIDGQVYGEADVKTARLAGAASKIGQEAAGCGVSALWIYVGLPLLALLMFALLSPVSGCVSTLFSQ